MIPPSTRARAIPAPPDAARQAAIRIGGVLAVLLLAAQLGGCGAERPAEAENRETRLTANMEWNSRPSFSPDGKRIAFSSSPGSGEAFTVRVVSSEGGEPTTISPDTLSLVALRWTPEGDGFYCVGLQDGRLRVLGLDGHVRRILKMLPLAGIFDAAPGGEGFLFGRFQGDNYDAGILDASSEEFQALRETEAWEVDGCFGPRDDEVTVVVRGSLFSEDSRVEVWNRRTIETRILPVEEAKIYSPRWSADGRYLAYASDLNGNRDLWVLDASIGETYQITAGPEEDVFPFWSPDGNRIAFARRTSTQNIFVMSADGEERRQLTQGQQRNQAPTLSPDGTRLAFVHNPTQEEQRAGRNEDILVVSVEGGEPLPLRIEGLSVLEDATFTWSPDGRQIAFAADDGAGTADIFRIPADGSGPPVRVTVTPGSDVMPRWSPDGKTIAYTRIAGGQTQVWTISANGGIPRQVSFSDAVNQYAVWSGDSSLLCYISGQKEGAFELRVVEVADPANTRTVYRNEAGQPALPLDWSEDGTEVLAWKGAPDDVYVIWALPVDGREAYEVGRPQGKEGAERHLLQFTSRGERHRDRIYPHGITAYPDGDHVSDIFVIRVGDILRAGASGRSREAS